MLLRNRKGKARRKVNQLMRDGNKTLATGNYFDRNYVTDIMIC